MELLYRAGGQCAICHRQLRLDDEESRKSKHIADIAHIYPVSEEGERAGQGPRPTDVNDISNLIPLCPSDHRTIDWQGVGGRRWPRNKLLKLKKEHEAWVAFQRDRPPAETIATAPELAIKPGNAVVADGQSYRLPWEPREEGIAGAFTQEWSPDRDAVRCAAYAYAETGDARHVWLRRVAARDGSAAGARWRRELTDEAALLVTILEPLPGLPRLLAVDTTPVDATIVTALPTVTSMRDQFTTEGATEEAVRALFAGLPTLCAALGALHDAGFAHGALDPAAIMVDRRGNLVLRDLGLATATGGTAVDQARAARRASARDDVTTLARIVYQCVTGVAPLNGADGPPVAASDLNRAVPEPTADTLTRALAGDLDDPRRIGQQLKAAVSRSGCWHP